MKIDWFEHKMFNINEKKALYPIKAGFDAQ